MGDDGLMAIGACRGLCRRRSLFVQHLLLLLLCYDQREQTGSGEYKGREIEKRRRDEETRREEMVVGVKDEGMGWSK